MRKKLKHERKRRPDRDSRSRSPDDRRRAYQPPLSHDDRGHLRRSPSPYDRLSHSRNGDVRDHYSPPRRIRRSPSPEHYRHRSDSRDRARPTHTIWPRSDESDDSLANRNSKDRSQLQHSDRGKRLRSRSPQNGTHHKRFRTSRSPPPSRLAYPTERPKQPNTAANDREARLAAMASSASTMSTERQERLAAMLEKEKAELAAEEQARAKSKGMGGFLSHEQKKVFGGLGGLEDRMKRGRGGMVVDND